MKHLTTEHDTTAQSVTLYQRGQQWDSFAILSLIVLSSNAMIAYLVVTNETKDVDVVFLTFLMCVSAASTGWAVWNSYYRDFLPMRVRMSEDTFHIERLSLDEREVKRVESIPLTQTSHFALFGRSRWGRQEFYLYKRDGSKLLIDVLDVSQGSQFTSSWNDALTRDRARLLQGPQQLLAAPSPSSLPAARSATSPSSRLLRVTRTPDLVQVTVQPMAPWKRAGVVALVATSAIAWIVMQAVEVGAPPDTIPRYLLWVDNVALIVMILLGFSARHALKSHELEIAHGRVKVSSVVLGLSSTMVASAPLDEVTVQRRDTIELEFRDGRVVKLSPRMHAEEIELLESLLS